jgi:hypothetical protein
VHKPENHRNESGAGLKRRSPCPHGAVIPLIIALRRQAPPVAKMHSKLRLWSGSSLDGDEPQWRGKFRLSPRHWAERRVYGTGGRRTVRSRQVAKSRPAGNAVRRSGSIFALSAFCARRWCVYLGCKFSWFVVEQGGSKCNGTTHREAVILKRVRHRQDQSGNRQSR